MDHRDEMLRVFARQLGDLGHVDVNVDRAARTLGVGAHHIREAFPDRTTRVEALAVWADKQLGPVNAPLDTADDLPRFAAAAYRRASQDLSLMRAVAITSRDNRTRIGRLAEWRSRIEPLLAELGAPEDMTRRATATVALITSAEGGFALADLHGLSTEDATTAAEEAVAAIVAALRAAGQRLSSAT